MKRPIPRGLLVGIIGVALTATTIFVAARTGSASAGTDIEPGEKSLSLGESIYIGRCAPCHGNDGRGDGPQAAHLHPKPRDFTSALFKIRSTESGSIPTDDDLAKVITNGMHGTSMPAWGKSISGDSLSAVIGYVKSFSTRFQTENPRPVRIGEAISPTAASIALGKFQYERAQCGACHGTDGKGTGALTSTFLDASGEPLDATDLTEPWTFRGGSTARDIYLRFRTGMDGTPMPSYVGTITDQEMWHLANYVLSLARKPVWQMTQPELVQHYAALDEAALKNPVRRGEYLVKTLGCAECHTPVREDGRSIRELLMAGGQRWDLGPYGEFVAYNLTSDKETGLGEWTDDEIKKFVTTGVRRDGTRMLPYPMPWTAYANMKSEDLDALVAYLRTIPAIQNKIPLPKPRSFFGYLWGKFRMLILNEDIPGYLYPGNAGQLETELALESVAEGRVSK